VRWTASELASACGGELIQEGGRQIATAFIDSRRAVVDGLFVPIVAERDGHDFAASAAQGGAAAILWQKDRPRPQGGQFDGLTIVEVDDTLAAFGELARDARDRIEGPVVAITGSNGKTTTRAMVQAVLQAGFKSVLCTQGNLNNHLGVPLSLLAEPHHADAAVLELGMSAPGENDHLAGIVRPNIGIVTSIALEHLEFMGSLEAIAKAEAEVMPHVRPAGTLVIPMSEPLLEAEIPHGYRPTVARCGEGEAAAVRIHEVEVGRRTRAVFSFDDAPDVRVELSLQTFGAHNARNAASALAVGRSLGLPVADMVAALESVEPVGDRGRLVEHGETVVIGDCYNANPGSMEVALRSLAMLRVGGHAPLVAVLGDMLELGPREESLHHEVGRLAAELGIDAVVGFGPRSSATVEGAIAGGAAGVHVGQDVERATRVVQESLAAGPRGAVLFKGSRGMALERVMSRYLES
jgi:UDP-N-acetylmuramoyl-tripeptide--D-alanyl-D-alanine ligase